MEILESAICLPALKTRNLHRKIDNSRIERGLSFLRINRRVAAVLSLGRGKELRPLPIYILEYKPAKFRCVCPDHPVLR